MNIPFVVETVLHDGLLKYKFKNSKIRSITTKPGKSKGAIFAYRSKKRHDWRTWRCSDFQKKRFTKIKIHLRIGHQTFIVMVRMQTKTVHTLKDILKTNLRQINTFFIDFDIHTEKRNYFSKRYFNNSY